MANSKHFYSESPQGMTLQVYIALIGTLLIALETGSRPSSYDFALMSMAAAGLAPLDQILAQAAKRRAERRRAAERQRARWAEKDNRQPPSAPCVPTRAAEGARPTCPAFRPHHRPSPPNPRHQPNVTPHAAPSNPRAGQCWMVVGVTGWGRCQTMVVSSALMGMRPVFQYRG